MGHRFLSQQNHPASATPKASALDERYLFFIIPTVAFIVVFLLIIRAFLKRRRLQTSYELDPLETPSHKYCGILKKDHLLATSSPRSSIFPPNRAALFTLRELSEATDGFQTANLLSEGKTFKIYRGFLKSGRTVAVKRMDDLGFHHEARIVSRLQHKNIVSLIGYCKHEGGGITVCEYVSDKSLYEHLHCLSTTLDSKTRINIALGIAQGIAYLHQEGKPVIVHRNIQTSSVFLDCNFEPKLWGFELARMGQRYVISEKVTNSSGHLDPELSISGIWTKESDVYAFGVLLIEIITGQKTEGKCSRDLIDLISGDAPIVDWKMGFEYDKEELRRLVEIVLSSVRNLPKDRPSMRQIVQCLEGDLPPEEL